MPLPQHTADIPCEWSLLKGIQWAAYLLPQLSPVGDNLVSLRPELALEFANDRRRLLHRRHLQMEGTITSTVAGMNMK